MIRGLGALVAVGAALAAGAPGLRGDACAPGPAQTWTLTADRRLSSGTAGGTLCATAAAPVPVPDGTAVTMQPCDSGALTQAFAYLDNHTLVLAAQRSSCLNLAGYGTSPGTQAWLFACSATDCRGNCDWTAPAPGVGGAVTQPESGLCLADGTAPPPRRPRTCDPGSPSVALPFCNASLPFAARVEDMYARLTPDARLALFSLPIQPAPYNATLNVAAFYWDITCIAGLSPGRLDPTPNVTVFPNAIAQAASFDTDLVARIARATALEGRIVNELNFAATGGTTFQGVHCDGGPLANTAHDPRCGRPPRFPRPRRARGRG